MRSTARVQHDQTILAPLGTVPIPVIIDDQTLFDLFVTGCEGGIQYWCTLIDYRFTTLAPDETIIDDLKGFKARIRLTEDDEFEGKNQFAITRDTIIKGLTNLGANEGTFAGRHLGNVLDQNADAETADVVIQMALFNEVIYG